MSSQEIAIPVTGAANVQRKQIWRNQLQTIVRLELKKNFFRLRGFWVYLLAFGPVLIIGAHTLDALLRGHPHPRMVTQQIARPHQQVVERRYTALFAIARVGQRELGQVSQQVRQSRRPMRLDCSLDARSHRAKGLADVRQRMAKRWMQVPVVWS